MIYIDNITSAQPIALPLYAQPTGNSYELAIKRTTTGDNYITIPTTYTSQDSLFVNLNATLPAGLSDGEYEYRLMCGTSIIGGGIIAISGSVYVDIEHNQDITYKEYESRQD